MFALYSLAEMLPGNIHSDDYCCVIGIGKIKSNLNVLHGEIGHCGILI